MQLWKLTLAYDGTNFHGWQVQPRLRTVQGALAAVLAELTGEQVLPQGSGRTDTGVHALGQVASFSLNAPIPPQNLLHALNRALPAYIRVLTAEHAAPGFHARHSAVGKTYEYRIFERRSPETIRVDGRAAERICSPMLAPFVWDCPFRLDFVHAQQAASKLCGEHDFTSFAAVDPDLAERTSPTERSSVRTMLASEWRREGELLIYRVTGNGFLHHMVRNFVGTLVEIARVRLAPADMEQILVARDRAAAGPTAPACGLFLMNVDYPVFDDEAAGQAKSATSEAMA